MSILSRLSCLSFPDIAPPSSFFRHPQVNPKALCDVGIGHAQPAEMQDLVGYPHVNRDGIFVRQVHLDWYLGGSSNSFRWGAPTSSHRDIKGIRTRAAAERVASWIKASWIKLIKSSVRCIGKIQLLVAYSPDHLCDCSWKLPFPRH